MIVYLVLHQCSNKFMNYSENLAPNLPLIQVLGTYVSNISNFVHILLIQSTFLNHVLTLFYTKEECVTLHYYLA